MYSIPVWRGPAGGLEPEDRVRVDVAIETAETINARIGEATEARDTAVAAAAATDADAQAAEAGRQQAVQAAGDAAAAALDAAEQKRQAADAARRGAIIGVPISNPLGWDFQRNSVRVGWNQSGSMEEMPAGQAQGGYAANGEYQGILINQKRTNWLPNPNAVGASSGTITGSATQPPMPVGWVFQTRNTGTQIDIAPISAMGRPALSMRFRAGAALTSSTADAFEFAARNAISAAAGEVWCLAFWCRISAGSMPGAATVRTRILSRAGTTVVDNVLVTRSLTSSWALITQSQVMGSGVTHVTAGVSMTWVTGVTPDITIEIAAPQLFRGASANLPVLPPASELGPYTREQDIITVPASVLGGNLGQSSGSLWGTITSYYPGGSDDMGVISLGDGSAENVIGVVIDKDYTSISLRMILSGVESTPSTCAIPASNLGGPLRFGMSWGNGQIQVFACGIAGAAVAAAGYPPITQAMIGRFASLLGFDGSLSNLDVRPTPIWGSDGAALTA